MRKSLATLLIGASLIALSGSAAARPNIDIGISFGYPAPVYVAPPPVAYYPRPVYVEPPPVYYQPAPVYYYGPPPGYYRRDNGRHRGWDRHHQRGHWD